MSVAESWARPSREASFDLFRGFEILRLEAEFLANERPRLSAKLESP